MINWKAHVFLLFLPLLLGNVLNMILVKKNGASFLAIPLSIDLFGTNKTWRGFVFLPLVCAFIAFVNSCLLGCFTYSHAYDILVGAGLGLAYLISELPNSYVKRKLGIKQGELSAQYKYVQFFVDKADSIVGVLLFYYFATAIPFSDVFYLFFISLSIHIGVSLLLVRLKIKQSF